MQNGNPPSFDDLLALTKTPLCDESVSCVFGTHAEWEPTLVRPDGEAHRIKRFVTAVQRDERLLIGSSDS